MASQAKLIIVHGRVQGVGFRYFVQHLGSRYGLTGNVRNCEDGTVEIIAEGNPRRLAEFVHEVQKGPSLARVEWLDVNEIPAEGNYSTFQIEGW